MTIPRIILTPGEPAGIGPDIILQIAKQSWPAELVIVCDPELLLTRAKQLQTSIQLTPIDLNQPAHLHEPNHLKIIPLKLNTPCKAGQLDAKNAAYVINSLELSADYCLQKKAHALVTGPVHKAILNDAGFLFKGHTEFLKERCHAKQALMLFVVDKLKVALATTHIPLNEVSKKISHDGLLHSIRLLHNELQTRFSIANPHILVCGLNPHAGESGHLGQEEINIITPAIYTLRSEAINVTGPLPADTVFTEHHLKSADAIFAMYHDQALPVVKYIGFDRAVNVTLGLPIIRTSVDHGTALDLAGTGKANAGSLTAALNLAISLKC